MSSSLEKKVKKCEKRFKRASSYDARMSVCAEFLDVILTQLTESRESALAVLNTGWARSINFTTAPVRLQEDPSIEWCLGRNWFLEIIAQTLRFEENLPVKFLFEKHGWDYEACVSPNTTDVSTVEKFIIAEMVAGGETAVSLSLVCRAKYPLGTMFKNIRSNKEYEVTGVNGFEYELSSSKWVMTVLLNDLEKRFLVTESVGVA